GPENVSSRVPAHLDRNGGHSRERRPSLVAEDGEVADHEYLGVSWNREVWFHDDASRLVERHTKGPRERRSLDAGRPEDRLRLHSCRGGLDEATHDSRDRCTRPHVDSEGPQPAFGRAAQGLREGAQEPRSSLEEHDARFTRVDPAKVAA